jgi:hypothetical protein
MYSRVAWRQLVSFTRVKAVAAHGVGRVERNIVARIMIPSQGSVYRALRIIMIHFAVSRRKDSRKRSIVVGGIRVIVPGGGKTCGKIYSPSKMRGGGSYYQPIQYVSRGGQRLRGGFYPSIMGGVLSNGPILFTPALASGFRLLRNNTERMRSRSHSRSHSRNRSTRRSKRTLNRRKNTRKA